VADCRDEQGRPTCADCGARSVRSRGRCNRCYRAVLRKEQRESGNPAAKTPRPCTECNERNSTRKGLCDRCYQARRRREYPERTSAIARAYHARNRSADLARMHQYYAEHAEQVKAYRRANRVNDRAYYRQHKDEINARRRAARAQSRGAQ
jgi:hypothetical protein